MAGGILLLMLAAFPQAAGLKRFTLSAEPDWVLTNSNSSIQLPVKLPGHVLGMLAAAGLVQPDPLYRYGEIRARWVSQEPCWNFTLVWPGAKHTQVASSKHVLLALHGVDTFSNVILNGHQVAATNNAHRDWGPAFVPAGITGAVELLGFDRATVI
eukprot:gene988-1315_t